MKKALCLFLLLATVLSLAGCRAEDPPETNPPETVHIHSYTAVTTPPTCDARGFTTHTCLCGDSFTDEFLEATGEHLFEEGFCTQCGLPDPYVDLFVFAGQSNMMGAAALGPQTDTFTDKAWEYKYMPRLRTGEAGEFVPAGYPVGEFHYKDLTVAYGDRLTDLSYRSTLIDYSVNTYFCPSLRDGARAYTRQSEASNDPAPSLAPYFVTEYASYGHSSVYTHMCMGSARITYYFTQDMLSRYNRLIEEYNIQNGTSFLPLTHWELSGAGEAFEEKNLAMEEDFSAFAPDKAVKNRCFVWLQGESDSHGGYAPYLLKLQVLWEHLQEMGFTHFFVLRVGYWDNPGILDVIRAQEDFCAGNENCHIITRAPSLIPCPGATTQNWWLEEPAAEYENCRDCYLNGRGNLHFNEKAMVLFAQRSAENVHRILHLGEAPILEAENIRGMAE